MNGRSVGDGPGVQLARSLYHEVVKMGTRNQAGHDPTIFEDFLKKIEGTFRISEFHVLKTLSAVAGASGNKR